MENIKQTNEFYTSYSKMDTYKSCPQQYKYKYIDKLEPKTKKRSLYVGTHIHKLIELFYVQRTPELLEARREAYNTFMNTEYVCANPDVPFEEIQNKADELLKDTLTWREYLNVVIREEFNNLSEDMKNEVGLNYVEDLAHMMAQYEYYYSNDKIEVLDIEHNKKCYLGTYNGKDVQLVFICDGVVRLPNKKIYILEHKSYKDNPMTFEDTWLNTQTAIYVSALRAQGYEIEGVLWDNIKSTAPKAPNILKNGSYGKQTSNVTLFSFIDFDTIMAGPEAVIEFINNLPQEVRDLGIDGNKDNFLSRHITVFNEKAVDEILSDTSKVLGEITKDEPLVYRNMGWTCNGCSFRGLCQAQMLGQDVDILISTLYNKKD